MDFPALNTPNLARDVLEVRTEVLDNPNGQ
jgi:hypothetical protein